MPRQARIDFPGALHHVIGRGIEKKNIFSTDKDKQQFYKRLRKILEKSSLQLFAWCIMDNHFHLLLQTGQTSLSEFMRRILTSYALYYNKTYKRVGHLFQNRYKSILCDMDDYLLILIRYIHLNPVKAKKIDFEKLREYHWTGHREIVNDGKERIINRDEILRCFGQKEGEARQEYIKFVKNGVELREDFEGGGLIRSAGGVEAIMKQKKDMGEMFDERILGSGDFVEQVLDWDDKVDVESMKFKDVEDLLKRLALFYQVDKESIKRSRVKNVREARNVFVFIANQYLGKTLTDLGKMLGITTEAASIARKRGMEIDGGQNVVGEICK